MNIVKCPKCDKNIEIDISKAIDEFGEVFLCKNCGCHFRYAPNG
jgi:uncharacterized protein YbaR (Trm112 family)